MRRHAIVYTLPPIILIAFLVVISMTAWQRSQTISKLASTLAHGGKADVEAAARQLAAVSNPPLKLLVDLASSDDRIRAEAAQAALTRVLYNLERDADAGQRLQRVSDQAAELAAALAVHRHAFSPLSHSWLIDTTRRVLSIANRCPTGSPLVGLHCDDVISVVELARPTAPALAEQMDSTSTTPSVPERDLQRERLEREFAGYAAVPSAPEISPLAPISAPTSEKPEPSRVTAPPELPNDDAQLIPPATTAVDRPTWSEPVMRLQPEAPIQSGSTDAINTDEENQERSTVFTTDEEPPDSTHELLDRWRSARFDRSEIEDELLARGFCPIPKRLVEQYFSDDLADRLRLVDNVLTEPNLDARPWLMLLAEDENAEVRLMAVTVMATSDDKTLVEKAWQTAIRDRDSRIADLAARLRARREGAARR
jgi:hypothetical protein